MQSTHFERLKFGHKQHLTDCVCVSFLLLAWISPADNWHVLQCGLILRDVVSALVFMFTKNKVIFDTATEAIEN